MFGFLIVLEITYRFHDFFVKGIDLLAQECMEFFKIGEAEVSCGPFDFPPYFFGRVEFW